MVQYIMLQSCYSQLDILFDLVYGANFILDDNVTLDPRFYPECFGYSVVLVGKKWH